MNLFDIKVFLMKTRMGQGRQNWTGHSKQGQLYGWRMIFEVFNS